jgi:hypothetical protein
MRKGNPIFPLKMFVTSLLPVMLFLSFSSVAYADYTIPVGSNINASTITNQSGVLTINGTLTLSSDAYLPNITAVVINAPSGQIYWTNNSDLTFKAGTTIFIDEQSAGLQPTSGNGNSSQRLIIGSAIIAVSSDKSSVSTFTFEQFNLQGGIPQYTITSNSPVCVNTPLSVSISPDKIISGVTYSYQWSISPASASFTNANSASATISPVTGDYTITCVATANTFATTKTIRVTVRAANTWLGINNNWADAANWCPGVPTATSDVTIPYSNDYPVISGATTATVKNLTISTGATLRVNGILKVSGTITNNGNLIITDGTLEMNGSAAQTIAGSMFYNKTIENLIVSNFSNSGLSVSSTLNDTLKISGALTFGASTSKLNTGDNINLLSTSSGTARVGMVNTGNTITGKVIVDRYISTGTGSGQHAASWQFLSTPTNGQTVKQSWMEDQRTAPGYGIFLTAPAGTTGGFDAYSPGAAIKYYDDATNNWVGVSNANQSIYNSKGYMVFVRGDRTVNGTTVRNATPTILRSKGNLITGTQAAITLTPGKYLSIGNPYASPVDFSLLIKSGSVDNQFYVWDPFLYGVYGYGGYQTISGTNNWKPVPGGTTSYPTGVANKMIQSGQAIFVHSTNTNSLIQQTGSISFSENSKATGSGSVNFARMATTGSTEREFFRASLFSETSSGTAIADGNAVAFDPAFSDNIDGDDALKLSNGGENFGIKSQGKLLAVEAKAPVSPEDTITYNMTNLRRQNYQFQFVPENMESGGLQAFLLDQYLNTSTPISLSDTSFVNITVTSAAASSAADRFKVVFKQMAALPVTFISINAIAKNKTIDVDWTVGNEGGLKKYKVEKSTDGSNFVSVGEVAAQNNGFGKYQWTDHNPSDENNYYRIASISKDDVISYSEIVRVKTGKTTAAICVFPNPAKKGMVHLQFINQPSGKYSIRLINSLGEIIFSKEINHLSGSDNETIRCEHLRPGIYRLQIKKPDGTYEGVIPVLIN